MNIKDDPAAGSSLAHPPTDQAKDMLRGLGEHNNQILMTTPDGKIINALAGYIGPGDLVEEIQFAVVRLGALGKGSEASKKTMLAKAHWQFAEELDKRQAPEHLRSAAEFFGKVKRVGPKRGVDDHQFVAQYPLLSVKSFTAALMVGNGSSSFASAVNGTPTEAIGGNGSQAKIIINGKPFPPPKP